MKHYIAMSKPRLLLMVLVTAVIGFIAADAGSLLTLGFALVGLAFSGAGASMLNQYIERVPDSMMERTKYRPIPSGDVEPHHALACGVLLVLSGVAMLAALVNLLTAFLALLTAFLYVIVYTPMKRISWLNTSIGAIPGALPIMAGWTASGRALGPEAWFLFLILFLWQHPHFFAIAWLYRDDYERGGFKMLPVLDDRGKTFTAILVSSLMLWFVSLLPLRFGFSPAYLMGATFLGAAFTAAGIFLSLVRTPRSARALFHTSLIYLPCLLILLVVA